MVAFKQKGTKPWQIGYKDYTLKPDGKKVRISKEHITKSLPKNVHQQCFENNVMTKSASFKNIHLVKV